MLDVAMSTGFKDDDVYWLNDRFVEDQTGVSDVAE